LKAAAKKYPFSEYTKSFFTYFKIWPNHLFFNHLKNFRLPSCIAAFPFSGCKYRPSFTYFPNLIYAFFARVTNPSVYLIEYLAISSQTFFSGSALFITQGTLKMAKIGCFNTKIAIETAIDPLYGKQKSPAQIEPDFILLD
jgi:hypothetical protein